MLISKTQLKTMIKEVLTYQEESDDLSVGDVCRLKKDKVEGYRFSSPEFSTEELENRTFTITSPLYNDEYRKYEESITGWRTKDNFGEEFLFMLDELEKI